MDSLIQLRQRLSNLNFLLFELFHKRKLIVQQIQNLKEKSLVYYCFDPQQEFNLFMKNKIEFTKMDLKELFSFSLLIESHATTSAYSYPEWSKGEHLNAIAEFHFSHQINPILLAVVHKDLYDQLPLNSKFKQIIENTEGFNG